MRTPEGFLMVDHRASPGIPADQARKLGYHPSQVAEGQLFETKTYTCPHCTNVVVMNPFRTRERGSCFKCSSFICDPCAIEMKHPDYVHYSMAELAEKLSTDKYVLGGTIHRPVLKPKD